MAITGPGGPGPDLYELLGVARQASRQEIAQAWRRRARAEHPDSRPGDAAAPGRFRALAGAWHVLGDPGRRAAYDRMLTRDRPGRPAVPPASRVVQGTWPPVLPLWAGPVRVEGPGRVPEVSGRDQEERVPPVVLAVLMLRSAMRARGGPWDEGWPW
jgi:hypothetical protein